MPTNHYGKWRARWVDEHGVHRAQNCSDRRTAKYAEAIRQRFHAERFTQEPGPHELSEPSWVVGNVRG